MRNFVLFFPLHFVESCLFLFFASRKVEFESAAGKVSINSLGDRNMDAIIYNFITTQNRVWHSPKKIK